MARTKQSRSEDHLKDELEEQRKRLKEASDSVLAEFKCAISYELPVDPVTAEDGHVYERAAIEDWIARPGTLRSPKLNTPMGPRLLPAIQTRSLIERMVRSGTISGPEAVAWSEKLAEEKKNATLKKAQAEKVARVRAKAEGGDGDAILKLGTMFFCGDDGLSKDFKQAVVWFQRGHNLGYATCTMRLGLCYELAYGVEASYSMATFFYTVAAKNGSEHGCYRLGHNIACEYCGMKRDEREVKRWFRAMEKAPHRDSFDDCRIYAANWMREHAAE